MHDTTELRRLESLRRDFMANVSHELKTPLSSIKAYTETLRNGAMNDPETSQTISGAHRRAVGRLHHLIMDMLMLARIESDQQVFEIVPSTWRPLWRPVLKRDGPRPTRSTSS